MVQPEQDLIVSGKHSFKIEVPYQLIETGPKGSAKPLIVYLHGYGQRIETFQKKCSSCLKTEAYHLFIQGPYPIFDHSRKKNVSDWGRAWYLYDGNRMQFVKSLELASEFIQEIVDKLLNVIDVNRICLIGYSMGGYLAGYFALTRWKHVNELIVIGARIKTEILNESWENIRHLQILALHGKNDKSVSYLPQEKEIETLKEQSIKAELKLLDETHSFTESFVSEISMWLKEKGY